MSLADQDAGVVDAVGNLSLHDESLESAFHKLANGETEDIIELSLSVLKETKADHAANESLS